MKDHHATHLHVVVMVSVALSTRIMNATVTTTLSVITASMVLVTRSNAITATQTKYTAICASAIVTTVGPDQHARFPQLEHFLKLEQVVNRWLIVSLVKT